MDIVEIITKKRDGEELSREEIKFFIDGVMAETIKREQIGALLMAITLNGFSASECFYYADALASSGNRYYLGDKNPKFVDKHSTGGVSDACTLVVLPALAALGYKIAKYSTSGVGASFGTLDRLSVFSGYKPVLSDEEFYNCLDTVGFSIIGNNKKIIPADSKLYEIRKQTGTVPSLPLIAASIMSKKLAIGTKTVVLDIKCGEGSLLTDVKQAEELAKLMVQIGKSAGIKTTAIISNMNQPLGKNIGPMLEVKEAVELLSAKRGTNLTDLYNLCREMVAHIMIASGDVKSRAVAYDRFDKVIKSGQALKKLEAMIEAHGGDASSLHDISKLVPKANEIFVSADKSGYIFDIDTKKLYEAINYIGSDGGKTVNPNVGVEVMVREGDKVMAGDKLAKIYYSISDPSFATAVQFIRGCFEIKKVKPELENLIYKVIV